MEFTLKKNSWHYWVANFGDKRVRPEWDEGNDICSYTRAFLAGLFWVTVCGFALIAGATWIGASLWNLGELLFGDAKVQPWTGVFLAVILIALGLIAHIAIKLKIEQWLDKRPPAPEKPPGFVKLSYRKFKDKTCFRLNFE